MVISKHNFQNGNASMFIWKTLRLLEEKKTYILEQIRHQLRKKRGKTTWWLPNVPFLSTFDQKGTWWL